MVKKPTDDAKRWEHKIQKWTKSLQVSKLTIQKQKTNEEGHNLKHKRISYYSSSNHLQSAT